MYRSAPLVSESRFTPQFRSRKPSRRVDFLVASELTIRSLVGVKAPRRNRLCRSSATISCKSLPSSSGRQVDRARTEALRAKDQAEFIKAEVEVMLETLDSTSTDKEQKESAVPHSHHSSERSSWF